MPFWFLHLVPSFLIFDGSTIRHPNLLLFMGACTAGGQLAIVTEYVPGDNLQNILKNEKIALRYIFID